MNLSGAKHCLIESIVELNQIAGSVEYSGPFYSSLMLLAHADTIWFTGIGKSGLVAQRGASMMRTIGRRSQFIHPVDALHGDIGGVKDGDVIIVLSHSGETDEVNFFVGTLPANVLCIGICRPKSTLADMSDWHLPVEVNESIPTISCMAQNAWIDALVIALADNVEEILRRTHPAGEIGRRLHDSGTGEPERT